MNSQDKKVEKNTLEFTELAITESLSIGEMSKVYGGTVTAPAAAGSPQHGFAVPGGIAGTIAPAPGFAN